MDTNRTAEALFEQYSDMVYRIAMSYGNQTAMAEDVVQDVFLRYLKRKPCFDNPQHEKAWFIRVAVNCCKSMISSPWMKRSRPLEEAQQQPVFQNESENALYERLSRLPAKYRVVLYLRYYEEYEVNEIAKLLKVKPNTVSARLSRARKCMKQEILKEMEEHGNEAGIVE